MSMREVPVGDGPEVMIFIDPEPEISGTCTYTWWDFLALAWNGLRKDAS